MIQTPFPTLMELVRLICNAFDMGRPIKKELDNKALDLYVSLPEAMEYFRKPEIYNDLCWIFNSVDLSQRFIDKVHHALTSYIEIVHQEPANGLSRAQMMPILFRLFGASVLRGDLHIGAKAYQISIIDPSSKVATKAVPSLITYLLKDSYAWQGMIKSFDKTKKDKIASWSRGEHIPDLSSIKTLLSVPGMEKERTSIVLARAWDYLLNETNCEFDNTENWTTNSIFNALHSKMIEVGKSLNEVINLENIGTNPSNKDKKSITDHELEIQKIKSAIEKYKNPYFLNYFHDLEVAYIEIKKGNLKKSLSFYKSAIEKLLYRDCHDIERILDLAIKAASAIGPDKAFCKQIRKLQYNFRLALPHHDKATDSNNYQYHIQDWEIERYAEEFHKTHNSESLKKPKSKSGPLVLKTDGTIRYDYRNPNKVISMPLRYGHKRMPQLAYSVQLNDFPAFRKLLESGASANCLTSANESPMILALEKLSYDSLKGDNSKKFFNQLIELKIDNKTLNSISDKKRLTILHSAIKTCDPDIVSKILKLGPDINITATHDLCTPLQQALSILKIAKEGFPEITDDLINTPEMLEALRRESNAILGNNLHSYINFLENPEIMDIFKGLIRETTSNPKLNPKKIENIVKLLIDYGSDLNYKHERPIRGYTPLMFAVECGETKIVKHMLAHGGNPEISAYIPNKGVYMDCYEIAKAWRQHETLNLLMIHKNHP